VQVLIAGKALGGAARVLIAWSCSAMARQAGDRHLGVLGPMRMPYGRTISRSGSSLIYQRPGRDILQNKVGTMTETNKKTKTTYCQINLWKRNCRRRVKELEGPVPWSKSWPRRAPGPTNTWTAGNVPAELPTTKARWNANRPRLPDALAISSSAI